MASIKKRSWTYGGVKKEAYQVSFRNKNGKRQRKQFAKRGEADRFLRGLERHGALGLPTGTENSPYTVSDACERWLTACEKGLGEHVPVEHSTLHGYSSHVRNHIAPMIGGIRLSEVSAAFCKQFRDDLLARTSRANAKAVLTSFKAALKEAVDLEWMPTNPASTVRIRISNREKTRVAVPTKDEVRALLAKADELYNAKHPQVSHAWRRYRVVFMTFVFAGLRASELRGLTWKNVDVGGAVISVVQRADSRGHLGPPKSATSLRDIEIPKSLANALMDWQMACPPGDQNLVFPNGLGNVESIHNIHNRAWHPLQRHVGLVNAKGKALYTIHALRHFYASMLIDRGAPPKEVQIMLGHADIQTTMNIYGHLFEERKGERHKIAESMAADLLLD